MLRPLSHRSFRSGRPWPLAFGAGVVVVGSALGCGSTKPPSAEPLACPVLSLDCPGTAPSYANQVGPIIQAHCTGSGCHSPSETPNAPWAFTSEDDVSEWSFAIQADIADCLMPPPGSPQLSESDREALNTWLTCGAPNN
jgi:hypothetical protein